MQDTSEVRKTELKELASVACHVGVPETQAHGYADFWLRQEERRQFHIGCPEPTDRRALMLIVEAAKSLCSCDRDRACRLLLSASAEIQSH